MVAPRDYMDLGSPGKKGTRMLVVAAGEEEEEGIGGGDTPPEHIRLHFSFRLATFDPPIPCPHCLSLRSGPLPTACDTVERP